MPMIYAKTAMGQTAFQNRSIPLTPRQRSAFILFDGKRSADDVLKATGGLGVTPEDISRLLTLGLLAPLPVIAPAGPAVRVATASGFTSSLSEAQTRYATAYPIAARLTASLGLRGFRLNLAVEAAGNLEQLRELAPRIREAVGIEKFRELEISLYG